MASVVDIANLALSHLGDEATVSSIDPPEGSAQAEHCAMFYPLARDMLLEMFPWNFAKRRALLALRIETSDQWRFTYALPANCIQVRSVQPAGYYGDYTDGDLFELETADDDAPVLVTNIETATLLYTARVEDTSRFSPMFVSALSWLLAAYVAGPLIKGDAGAAAGKECWATFLGEFGRAATSSANQGKQRIERMAPWIADRGTTWSAWRDLLPARG